MISVANRVIAIGYQSVVTVWRVKAESRRVEASAFYRSTTQKRKPKFAKIGQDFDAKPRNSAQLVRLELQTSCSNQLSYAGAARYESSFNELINSSS
jgi:hypothetical protein